MSRFNKNILLLILLLLVTFQYFFTEISLFSKELYNSITGSNSLNLERIRDIQSEKYSLVFDVNDVNDINNIDFVNSHIILTGSTYITSDSPQSYSYLLDRKVQLSKIPLNSPNVIIDYNLGRITINDSRDIPKQFTVISEVEIYNKSNKLTQYDWQITSFYKGSTNYWLDRISYLIQNYIWIFAIFGFFAIKNNFGIVYDSVTKKPTAGAIARIFKDGKLYTTYITNVLGIVSVRLEKGIYQIQIFKAGYGFPSKLKPLKDDGNYHNLYFGEQFEVKKNNSRLTINIPIDPEGVELSNNKVNTILVSTLWALNNFNPYVIIFVAIGQMVVWPMSLDSWIFGLISLTLFLIRYYIYLSSKPVKGIVVNEKGEPIPNVSFQIYDSEWNKQVSTFTSNSKGRFESILLPDQYYLKVINPEWIVVNNDDGDRLKVAGKIVNNTLQVSNKIIVRESSLQNPS